VSWAPEGGREITTLDRLSEICAASKAMVLEPLMSQKGIAFGHMNVKQDVFFTLA